MGMGIDSGGHRTEYVYGYCKTRIEQGVFCLKGDTAVETPILKSNVSKASNGTQRSESMLINVNNSVYNLHAGDAQNFIGDENGVFNVALLKGTLSGTNGGKIVKVLWTQVSGPTVSIANADSMNASFTPLTNVAGEYKFELAVTVDDVTIKSETTVTTNLKPVAPAA